MISRPLVKYILTAASRDKLVLTLGLMILAASGLSSFLGEAGMTEKENFSLVFGSSGLRFLSVLGIVLFCSFYVRRSFETKEVEFLLSRPLSRRTFILSHAVAFYTLAILITIVVSIVVSFLGKPDQAGLLLWASSLGVETMIMASVSLFFSMVLSSASGAALAALGFYTLARIIGTLLMVASVPAEKPVLIILNNIMEIISVIVPRLDLMVQSSWLVYGVGGSGGITFMDHAGKYAHSMMEMLGLGGFVAFQGILFIALILSATLFDFLRRQF